MVTIFLAIALVMLLFAAMAVGVIFSNKPIKGTCGGIANIGLKGGCEICGGDQKKCDEQNEGEDDESPSISPNLGYDVMNKD